MSESSKTCSKCEIEKPVSDFYKKKKKSGGHTFEGVCKRCHIARVRNKQAANPRQKLKNNALYKKRLNLSKWADPSYLEEQTRKDQQKLVKEWTKTLNSTRMTEAQAWKDWIHNVAPDEWVADLYADEPWKNPRLSDAEKWSIRYRIDPAFNVRERVRNQVKKNQRGGRIGDHIRLALKRNGNSPRLEKLLGYSMSELRAHLESQFTDGMTWEAFMRGEIHIDHKHPKSQYDMSNTLELISCWSLENLQPLWATDNLLKFTSIEHEKVILSESVLQMDLIAA